MLPIIKEAPLGAQITAHTATFYSDLGLVDPSWGSKLLAKGMTIQTEKQIAGWRGEQLLAHTLNYLLPTRQFFFVSGLMLSPNLDVDALIIGPTGVWMYESKYWAGRIVCKGGAWLHCRVTRGNTLRQVPSGSPDWQWLHCARQLEEFMEEAVPELRKYCPQALRVRGAVIFTYPNACYSIENPRAPCFTLDQLRQVDQDPSVAAVLPSTFQPIPNFDEFTQQRLLEKLLASHRQFAPSPVMSPESFMDWWRQQMPPQNESECQRGFVVSDTIERASRGHTSND